MIFQSPLKNLISTRISRNSINKKSVMATNSEEFAQLIKKRIALYDDMNGQEKIVHLDLMGRNQAKGFQ